MSTSNDINNVNEPVPSPDVPGTTETEGMDPAIQRMIYL